MPEQSYLKDLVLEFTLEELEELIDRNIESHISRKLELIEQKIEANYQHFDNTVCDLRSQIQQIRRRNESYPMPPPEEDEC